MHVLKVEITGDWVDLDKLEFNLLAADDDTKVDMVEAEETVIPDGLYNAYDANGKFIRSVNVKNAYSNQLKTGYYFLMNTAGKVYPLLINNK